MYRGTPVFRVGHVFAELYPWSHLDNNWEIPCLKAYCKQEAGNGGDAITKTGQNSSYDSSNAVRCQSTARWTSWGTSLCSPLESTHPTAKFYGHLSVTETSAVVKEVAH